VQHLYPITTEKKQQVPRGKLSHFTFTISQFTIIYQMAIYQTKLRRLEQRMIDFSVEVIQFFDAYSKAPAYRSMVEQLLRSATSVGANYTEANTASSKSDFRNKIYIAKKEIAETRYWLSILSRVLPNDDFSFLEQEALELNLILQKIISTMKNGK